MLLTSNVLLLNVVLSLDDRLPNTHEGEFCTLHLSKTKIYNHRTMFIYSIAVIALLLYHEIIGIPIKLFLIPT